MTAPFVGTEDLEAVLRGSVGAETALAVIALDSGCEAIRTHLGQFINLVVDDEVLLNGQGTSALLLPELPVLDVTSIQVDDDDALVLDEDYYVDLKDGIAYRVWPLAWPLGKGNIAVTYSHGWAESEDLVEGAIERVPSDIRRVALASAQRFFISAGSTPPVQSETIGSYSYSTAAGAGAPEFSAGELAVLDPYRMRRYR